MTFRFAFVDGADEQVEQIAEPALEEAAAAIAGAIPEAVPVNHGVMRASYQTSVVAAETDGHPQARVMVGSPFWHWLEYGTAFTGAYRPVQRAVEGLGLSYEPK